MKKIILLAFIAITAASAFAQSEKFTAAMSKNMAMMDSGFTKPDVFLDLANTFERIGAAEKNQWLPYYYAAYCRINYAFIKNEPAGNDPIADKATELLNKADSLQPNNSEVSVLRSMVATSRMVVNPMQRYQEYGPVVAKELAKAMEQDSTNPRPHLIKGQNLKYTPEQFGGGCKTAKKELETAVEKFAVFKATTALSPIWGNEYAQKLLQDCNK